MKPVTRQLALLLSGLAIVAGMRAFAQQLKAALIANHGDDFRQK